MENDVVTCLLLSSLARLRAVVVPFVAVLLVQTSGLLIPETGKAPPPDIEREAMSAGLGSSGQEHRSGSRGCHAVPACAPVILAGSVTGAFVPFLLPSVSPPLADVVASSHEPLADPPPPRPLA